jgi:hypothetical protein
VKIYRNLPIFSGQNSGFLWIFPTNPMTPRDVFATRLSSCDGDATGFFARVLVNGSMQKDPENQLDRRFP